MKYRASLSLFFLTKLRVEKSPQTYQASSRQSTHNHQRWGLGVAWEALGGGLGGILGPRAAQESKRETNLGSLAHLGVPTGPPLGTLFSTCFAIVGVSLSRVFEALFWRLLGSMFSWIWGVFCYMFLMFLCCVSGASITKENVVLIQYVRVLSTSTVLKKKENKV